MSNQQPNVVLAGRFADGRVALRCRVCGEQWVVMTQMQQQAFIQAHLHPAVGLGDVIAAGTSAVGIKPCSPCEERRRRLNQMFPLWRR